jgi:hypothetical protein
VVVPDRALENIAEGEDIITGAEYCGAEGIWGGRNPVEIPGKTPVGIIASGGMYVGPA